MENKLELKIREAMEEFCEKAINEINPMTYFASGKPKPVNVTKKHIQNALTTLCPKGKATPITKELENHFDDLGKLIPFCSSPRSFRSAWELRSDFLNKLDADTLVNEGGQLIPNNKSLRLFQSIQQGVELDANGRLILAVRHVAGNYNDNLDDLGQFTYQPPADATGMLRYRWCQYLSKKLQIPFVIIAVMWFKYKINKSSNLIFIASPTKIIKFEDDLKNLGDSFSNPLTLQTINRSEVYNILNRINSLGEATLHIEARMELAIDLAREWSYERINSTEKGRQLKRWAQKTGKTCPGSLCNHIKFEKLDQQKIAFGHIVSQDWTRSFTFLLDKKDHPDNLYLTCQNCNSSLNNNFPDVELRNQIVERGTIGDWLRNNESDIRNSSKVR